jgi:mRNA interferase RelE/StbE
VTYTVTLSRAARRALTDVLPESVAAACFEFIAGPLANNPQRVGKQLGGALTGCWSARRGEFRLIYSIEDHAIRVHVLTIQHRRDAYHGAP